MSARTQPVDVLERRIVNDCARVNAAMLIVVPVGPGESSCGGKTCTPSIIGVKITASKDAEAALKYKAALETNLPGIAKVAVRIA